MGLDMNLYALEKEVSDEGSTERHGYEEQVTVTTEYKHELKYWRKHSDLHGFITSSFGQEGTDHNCEDIFLTVENLLKIINTIENDQLPSTSGFFWGQSGRATDADPEEAKYYKEQKAADLAVFQSAIDWLNFTDYNVSTTEEIDKAPPENLQRAIVYWSWF